MQENKLLAIKNQPRFGGIFEDGKGFGRRIRLTSHIYDNCSGQIQKAICNDLNGSAVAELEKKISSYLKVPFAIATNSGTSAMHLAYKLAARKAYGTDSLDGKRVFCSDLCPIEQAMPILYEKGIPTFIDINNADYNMDPECLEMAFEIYPDTRIVVTNHLYGFPGQITEIKRICDEHGAVLIENAADSFGAKAGGSPTGSIGDIGVLDFGKDKIISGDCGGILIAKDENDAELVRKWTSMSRRNLPWIHVDAVGYDYRMNDLSAAMILAQLEHIDEIIGIKKKIYENYLDNISEDLAYMIESPDENEPNYWIPVMMCDSLIDAKEVRTEDGYSYQDIHGTSSPMEIVDVLEAFGAETAPIYMAMSLQPVFNGCELITLDGQIDVGPPQEETKSLFISGIGREASTACVCLPSDLSMTADEQSSLIELVQCCFDKADLDRKAFMAVG